MEEILIAPCGMNCGVCASYLAMKHGAKSKGVRMPYCAGCLPRGKLCAYIKKNCGRLGEGGYRYCFECPDFPCHSLRHIDSRYRSRYHMSMVQNLEQIRDKGIKSFLEREAAKWRCPECGGVICCHNGVCFDCGLDRLKGRKGLYRWE